MITAIIEKIEVKQDVFAELAKHVQETAVLASNTSSIPITSLAADTVRPDRVVGMHFFNPVPLMRLVEVIEGLLTEPWVGGAVWALGGRGAGVGGRGGPRASRPGGLVGGDRAVYCGYVSGWRYACGWREHQR